MSNFYVRPDGQQLGTLAQLLAERKLSLSVDADMRLEDAERALASVIAGSVRGAVVICSRSSR